MRRHDRYDYHPMPERADYSWPDGRRLAVYLALNLEHFAFGEGLGAELAPGGPAPDVLNYAWRDYGNRVGAWRLLAMFDALGLPCSVLANTAMYDYAPALMQAFRARGDEFVGHGRTNSERQGVLSEAEERGLIAECARVMAEREGRAPTGWLGPWISQSHATPDLLAEAGFSYMLDWCHDDQPIWFRTRRGGRILSVPYPQELNDIPQIVGRKQEGDAFADMIVDAFDEMLEESRDRPLVMGVALHPYLVGWPHRARHLRRALRHVVDHADGRVWLTTAGAIARHAAELPAGIVPGQAAPPL
ncbi:polysaccharide deacetylase family protein [Alsobacter sp. SYSU BS001988]|jgi:peptidoglycan/xylan/chitin deacetylase (PgdA/CDA1 family)